MEYILIFISAIFVNNIVLSQFLGICPFLGVSKKIQTSLGMGMAVAFVLTVSTVVTFILQKCVLDPLGLQYLQTIAFILVIAALVQMVEIILKRSPLPSTSRSGYSCHSSLPTVRCLAWPYSLYKRISHSSRALSTRFPRQLASRWHLSSSPEYVSNWLTSTSPKA